MNTKLDAAPKGLVVLVGDLNVNASRPYYALASLKEEMKSKGIALTTEDCQNLQRLENEYEAVMDILSNFGEEKITDCLKVNIDAHDAKVADG